MRTKLLKGKTLLLAGLTFALVGTAAGAGISTIRAAAEEEKTLTVGEFVCTDGGGYVFNGTSDGTESTISYLGDLSAYFMRVRVSNYTSGNVVLNMTSKESAQIRGFIYSAGGWVNSSDVMTWEEMTPETPYTKTFNPQEILQSMDTFTDKSNFDLTFSFKSSAGVKNRITVNSLTVNDVSYTLTEYDPSKDEVVEVPEISFKEHTDWTVTNGTASANTLDKLEGDAAEGTVDNAAANIAVTDVAQPVKIEIPLSQSLTAWPTEWAKLYVKVKTTGIQKILGYIETEVEDNAFCNDFFGKAENAWQINSVPSISEDYKLITINLSDYFSKFIGKGNTVSKIILVPVVESGATSAIIEFGGMTFGYEAPTFINDIGTPELAISEWVTWHQNLTVENKGELVVDENTTYSGLKFTWGSNMQADPNIAATVSNFDANKTSKLHIGFYTDSEMKFGVGHGGFDPNLSEPTTYAKGYHNIEIDVSEIKTSTIDLKFFIESGVDLSAFEGTKNVVFDKIVFHNDVEVAFDEYKSNGSIYTVTPTESGMSWTYDVANVAGLRYYVAIPVENWYSFNRYLVIDFTVSNDFTFTVFFNSGADVNGSACFPGMYDAPYAKGRYLLCFDTAAFFENEYLTENGQTYIYMYCDGSVKDVPSLTKKVTLNSVYFSDKQIVPSTVVTVNYMEQTIDFDDTKYEVSASEDFGTLILKGGAVTPGTTLYVRAKGGASEVTQIVLEKPALTADTVPQATVSDNYIRYTAEGYEYKFGENGEWTTLGSWGNLTAGTAYQIQIRIAATENSFASDIVTVTVTTTGGAETPNTDTETDSSLGGGAIAGIVIGCAAAVAIAAGVAVFVVKKRKK